MAANNCIKYGGEFKKSPVSLHQNGRTQAQLCREYGVPQSAPGKWARQHAAVETDSGGIPAAKQAEELLKRNALLEEENPILKKAAAIFTPHPDKGQMLSTGCAPGTALKFCAGSCGQTEALITGIPPQSLPHA